MKKLILISIVALFSVLGAKTISKAECNALKGEYIFSGGECIEYAAFEGEKKGKLIVAIHGAWKEGSNTLARYKPFAENINLETDITTVAIALPGYSYSSTNRLYALTHTKNATLHTAATKKYIEFLSHLLQDLKTKFHAKSLTVVAHSAGAMMTATVLGFKPGLIQNAALAGGRYDIHKITKGKKGLISAVDYIDNIPKDTKIAIIYGTKDTISKPKVSKEFYKLAKSKGLNVQLVKVNSPHLNLDMQDKSMETIIKLVQ